MHSHCWLEKVLFFGVHTGKSYTPCLCYTSESRRTHNNKDAEQGLDLLAHRDDEEYKGDGV